MVVLALAGISTMLYGVVAITGRIAFDLYT